MHGLRLVSSINIVIHYMAVGAKDLGGTVLYSHTKEAQHVTLRTLSSLSEDGYQCDEEGADEILVASGVAVRSE